MMKKLILILALTFPSNAFGEWTEVDANQSGDTYYLDFDSIKKHDGYVYWWHLVDFIKSPSDGILSAKMYFEGDCGPFRFKTLSYILYEQPMGSGAAAIDRTVNTKWKYPKPYSVDEALLKLVCEQ